MVTKLKVEKAQLESCLREEEAKCGLLLKEVKDSNEVRVSFAVREDQVEPLLKAASLQRLFLLLLTSNLFTYYVSEKSKNTSDTGGPFGPQVNHSGHR